MHICYHICLFFFNDPATTEIYTLSLHDALPILDGDRYLPIWIGAVEATAIAYEQQGVKPARPLTHDLLRDILTALRQPLKDRKSTRLNSSHANISYAVFCLKKKKQTDQTHLSPL